MAGIDPMAQKAARISKGNRRLEETSVVLRREASELDEELEVIRTVFQEQLDESKRRLAEDMERQENLCQPPDASLEAVATQLEDELARVRQAGERREKHYIEEMTSLKADLERREQQVQRMKRASQAMRTSVESDLGEFASLGGRVRQLQSDMDDLEDDCLKLHCQAEAWGMRVADARRQKVSIGSKQGAEEMDLRMYLEQLHETIAASQEQFAYANELCASLKNTLIVYDPQRATEAEVAAPLMLERSMCQLVEHGVQTQYLSEQARLRDQVDRLRGELSRARANSQRSSSIGESQLNIGPAAWLETLALCLRPRTEEGGAVASIGGVQQPAALAARRVPRGAIDQRSH